MQHPEFELDACRLAGLHRASAAALAGYQVRNRGHLRASMPARDEAFFTSAFWQARIDAYRDEFAARQALRLVLLDAHRCIGTITLDGIQRGALQAGYLGYGLDAASEGRGLMSQALPRAIDIAFTTFGLHRVMANHEPGNVRSERLLARLGFQREGFARSYLRLDGAWRDHVLTSLVNPHG